jgi:SAM-dependent methyltransferase
VPANFTRRRDLILDAGFPDPDAVVAALAEDVALLGWPEGWRAEDPDRGLEALRSALSLRVQRVPPDQRRLASHVPEWLSQRSGDLATALWLARAEHGGDLDVPGYLLAILDALAAAGRGRDALAYARFMLELRFDWGSVWREPSIAWEFLKEREPNPLVWRLLDALSSRGEHARVLDLGCGVGNDAVGFLGSDLVDGYVGVDVSAEALEAFRRRTERERARVVPTLVQGDFFEVLERPGEPARGSTLVYSYSSLHYFSSGELARIYALVRRLLLGAAGPGGGYFAFGIKGQGSVWDGQGLPLYRPDVWVNWDGQSRWFPSREALVRQLDRAGFEVRFHELHDHWGYSELGKRDVFHYVLLSPRGASPEST